MRLEWDHETPCFHKVMEGRNVYRDLSAAAIRKNLEDSLRRLQTDYIDIYYTHWQTPDFSLYPLEETMDTLLQLKKEGKIRAIGASNVTAKIIEKYCSLGQLDVIQENTAFWIHILRMNCYLYARNIMFPSSVLASGTGTAHRKSDTRHGAFSDRCAQQK